MGNVRIGNAGYALTVGVNGGGTVTPASGNYAPGSLQLEATPNSNWTFLRWEQGASGATNPLTITLGSNITVFARFSPNGSADLMVASASANTARAQRGDPLTVTWTVENYGGAAAAAS